MGKEAKVRKARKCWVCEQEIYATAKELEEHASQESRLSRIGLYLPDAKVRLGG